MVYRKSRFKELRTWYAILAVFGVGAAVYTMSPFDYQKIVGVVLMLAGSYFVFDMLRNWVKQVRFLDDRLEVQYYFQKKFILFASIVDVRLVKRWDPTGSWSFRDQYIDTVAVMVHPRRLIRLGGKYGSLAEDDTRQLFEGIQRRIRNKEAAMKENHFDVG